MSKQSSYFVRLTIAVTAIMGGCCLNNLTLELIVKADPSCGVLLTLLQFLTVSLEALPSQLRRSSSFPYVRFAPRVIPLSAYALMVFLFGTSSVLNNAAFHFNISLPLNTIFRSGTMVCNVILGALLLKQTFTKGQVISVITVTLGVVMVTLATLDPSSSKNQTESSFTTQVLGVGVLVTALLLTTSLGIVQDWTKNKFGKAPDEMRFYSVS
jgi:solute carrier family 35 (UDP-xylose/UDP-N-acetylglucosamine transporter), member B4